MARNRNPLVVPGAENALNRFKAEVAEEIGLHNYDQMDKGWLASRQNGYVGGNMTRKMVQYSQQVMAQQGADVVAQATRGNADVPNYIRQLNEIASQNFQGYVTALQNGTLGQLIQQGQETQQQYLQ